MQIAPILPPMKPSAPAASNRADGAQHTAYRVPEAMFKLRLLTRNINDDAENLLMLNKKIGQVLMRFFSEMQSVQRMANAEFADEEYAETVARALESAIEKLDNNTYWSLLRTLTLMGKIDAVRAGLGAGETFPSMKYARSSTGKLLVKHMRLTLLSREICCSFGCLCCPPSAPMV